MGWRTSCNVSPNPIARVPSRMDTKSYFQEKEEGGKKGVVCVCVWNSHHVRVPSFHTALVVIAKEEHSALLPFFQLIRKWPVLFKSYSLLSDWKIDRWHDWKTSLQSWETRLNYNERCTADSFSDRREYCTLLQVGWTVLWNVPFHYFLKAFWFYHVDWHCGTQDFLYKTQTALSPLITDSILCVMSVGNTLHCR